MNHATKRESRPDTGAAPGPIAEAWAALRTHLESRSARLNDEIRNYPTPIARCDEQLTGLIDQRAHALAQLERMRGTGSDHPHADCPALPGLHAFVNAYARSDDEIETAILARLRSALLPLHKRIG